MDWWKIVLFAIIGIIALCVIMHYVNRHYKIKYRYSLYPGGFFVLLSIAAIIFGYFAEPSLKSLGTGLMVGGGIIILLIVIINIKKCGIAAGIFALIAQLIFGVVSVFAIFTSFNGNDTTTGFKTSKKLRREKEEIERIRMRKGYDPKPHMVNNRAIRGYDMFPMQQGYGGREQGYQSRMQEYIQGGYDMPPMQGYGQGYDMPPIQGYGRPYYPDYRNYGYGNYYEQQDKIKHGGKKRRYKN